MVCIQTFVVMHVETSDLPGPSTLARVTEIAMYATTRNNLFHASSQQTLLPRVLNKMVFCVNPEQELHPKAEELTGLDYQSLQCLRPFDADLVMSMKLFLRHLPPPVCLVAHYGYNFDFPIIQAELNNICESLPDDIYCVDSLMAFQYMFPRGSMFDETNHFKKGFPQSTFERLNNHKLPTLYSFLVDCEDYQEKAYGAEDRVKTLLKCMAIESPRFIDHVDNYATLFCDTDPACHYPRWRPSKRLW